MKLSAYIIAYNEEEKIEQCIKSVSWVDEILLIDSNSTDRTPEIAKSLGAKVVNVKFEGFGKLRNSAIANCSNEWILSLDSDERCTNEVKYEILQKINDDSSKTEIFFIPRKNFFMGKWIKFSGWSPNYRQPQLFKNGAMTYDEKPVHEGFISHSKHDIGYLRNKIWQFPFKNIEEVMHKANRYSSLGVSKLKDKNKKSSVTIAFFHGFWAFFKHYILKLGILDGGPGFVIAIGNFEGTFYRYIKLYEDQNKESWKPK